eukprot:gene23024-biopygen10305
MPRTTRNRARRRRIAYATQKKIIPMKNYLNGPGSQGYLQDLPAQGLTSAGLTNNALSALVLQTGGYALTQGTGAGQLIGKYCKFTSTYMNVNITMDPQNIQNNTTDALDSLCPHQFRIIQVRARRDKMVAQAASTTTTSQVFPTSVSQHKSSRFKKYWLPKPSTKVRYPFGSAIGTTLEPIDYNFITHTVILCKNTSSGERPSNHWNVQVNGATAFIDE